jgi:hypothetical protein
VKTQTLQGGQFKKLLCRVLERQAYKNSESDCVSTPKMLWKLLWRRTWYIAIRLVADLDCLNGIVTSKCTSAEEQQSALPGGTLLGGALNSTALKPSIA